MKRTLFAALALASVCLSACATASDQPPAVTLVQARIAYNATCGEVLRLRQAGRDIPAARQGCVTASATLDAADAAYTLGKAAEAATGASRAMIYITAAQALVAASGAVK